MTAIDVPTRYPVYAFQYVGIISANERTPIARTARYGTRFGAIRRHSRCPGTAPSRENANIIRDADVTDAVRQKNCAIQQMKSRNVPQLWPIAATQLVGTM